jgi:Fe-S-cluster containining protein
MKEQGSSPVVGDTPPLPEALVACRRCGVCCTRHQARVRPEEVQRIIAYLGISQDDWDNLYNDSRWEYGDYRLIRHVNGACAFLAEENGLASCTIYEVRPACCTGWQPGPDKRDCRLGMAGAQSA